MLGDEEMIKYLSFTCFFLVMNLAAMQFFSGSFVEAAVLFISAIAHVIIWWKEVIR